MVAHVTHCSHEEGDDKHRHAVSRGSVNSGWKLERCPLPSTPPVAALSARASPGPETGLDLRKELRNVGEERKQASEGPALINSLGSNLWQPCVAPSACPCERLIRRLRATGRLIYESG